MEADCYGSRLALEGTTLKVTAKGRMGKGALGASERNIPLDSVTALRFERAGRMKNGTLAIVTANGKTNIHVRHKQNAEVAAMYDALSELVPPGALHGDTSVALAKG
jgi:hypothetical protein